jgi:GT2 family glycosyltransferase
MKPYQVTASIVVYKNDPREVVAAIRSVLDAPLSSKCTVVDNSPSPDLQQCVLENGAQYIFAGTNRGFGAGHNLAVKADGDLSEYHLVLNPDVYFAPETLKALYLFMKDAPAVGLTMPRILYPDGTDQNLCKQLPSPIDLISRRFLGGLGRYLFAARLSRYELRHLDLRVAREIPCLSGCFMLIRSKIFDEVGFFDERYFMYMEDVDLCRKIGLKYKTVFYPQVSVTHGYTKGSYRDPKLLKYHLQSALKYFLKWGWIHDPERRRLNRRTNPLITDTGERECCSSGVSPVEHGSETERYQKRSV